jgi:hypothetical protein
VVQSLVDSGVSPVVISFVKGLIPIFMQLNKEIITRLKKLNYKYLVIDFKSMVAYTRKSLTPKDQLEFLGFEQYEINSWLTKELFNLRTNLNLTMA